MSYWRIVKSKCIKYFWVVHWNKQKGSSTFICTFAFLPCYKVIEITSSTYKVNPPLFLIQTWASRLNKFVLPAAVAWLVEAVISSFSKNSLPKTFITSSIKSLSLQHLSLTKQKALHCKYFYYSGHFVLTSLISVSTFS